MPRKAGSSASAGGSTRSRRKAGTRSARKTAKSGRKGKGGSAAARRRQDATRGSSVASRVKNTARKVLFGSLGVAGYVTGAARRRDRDEKARAGVKPIPKGYHTVTPYLVVRDVPRLIQFLEQAFGATEIARAPRPDGSIMHAEVKIGDSRVMMGEPVAPTPPMPGCIHLYVVDADALYHLALQAGATSLREPTSQFYGDRVAGVQDPVGNQWWIATHVEDVSPVEIALRAAAQPGGP